MATTMRELAVEGAIGRIKKLREEEAFIRTMFPELAKRRIEQPAESEPLLGNRGSLVTAEVVGGNGVGKRHWSPAQRKAASARMSDPAHQRKLQRARRRRATAKIVGKNVVLPS